MPLFPSQRVVLIRGISDRLGTEDYPLIDVTLRQFSMPWSDDWRGDKYAYVLAMVQQAPDETLIDLAQHVGFQNRNGRRKASLRLSLASGIVSKTDV